MTMNQARYQITNHGKMLYNNLLNRSVQVDMLVSLSSWSSNFFIIIGQRVINCVVARSQRMSDILELSTLTLIGIVNILSKIIYYQIEFKIIV